MKTLSLIAAAVALLLASPAAAQTRDPASNTALAILGDCLGSLRGGPSFDTVMRNRGFKPGSAGGWVNGIGGGAVIAASQGSNTLSSGVAVKLCGVTLTPPTTDAAGLDAAIASRARPWSLKYMSPGPGNGGGVMRGWANLQGQGLLAITINEAPSVNGSRASTALSAIWR
jgi:hypothetical protein